MEITNKKLLIYHNNIVNMEDTIFEQYHRSKNQEFYRKNGARINSLNLKLRKLQEEYFVIENEQLKTEIVKIPQTQKKPTFLQKCGLRKPFDKIPDKEETRYVMNEEKKLEDFEKLRSELMSQKVNVEF